MVPAILHLINLFLAFSVLFQGDLGALHPGPGNQLPVLDAHLLFLGAAERWEMLLLFLLISWQFSTMVSNTGRTMITEVTLQFVCLFVMQLGW